MNSHELLTQVEATVSVLHSLWAEIGTTDDKRSATLEQLRASFAALCDDAVSRHRSIRDELAQRVDSHLRAIERIQQELNAIDDTDETAHPDDAHPPLLQRVEKLMLRLATLQKIRAERVDAITDLHEQLRQLWLELGVDMAQLPYTQAPQHLIRRFSCAAFDINTVSTQVDMDDLSSDRIARYEQLIAEARALKTQRQQQITKLCDDISSLSRELGVHAEGDEEDGLDDAQENDTDAMPLADDDSDDANNDSYDDEELLQNPVPRSPSAQLTIHGGVLDADDDAPALEFAVFATPASAATFAANDQQDEADDDAADDDDDDEDDDDDSDSVALFSLAMIEDLSSKLAQLQEEKRQRIDFIQHHKSEIASLWSRLKVSADESDAFLLAHKGLTAVDVEAYSTELQRLRQRKQQLGRQLIEEQRTELRTIILNTMAAGTNGATTSTTESEDAIMRSILGDFYEAYTCSEFDDRLLALHEDEVAKQKKLQQDMQPLLDAIGNRKLLLELKAKIEQCSRDPSRLQARSNGASNRLQQELRDQKQVNKLPDMEKALLKQLYDWESRTGRPFLYEGQRYITVIIAYQDAEHKKREHEKRLKEEAKKRPTQATTTPRVASSNSRSTATTTATSSSARVQRPATATSRTARGGGSATPAAPMTPVQPAGRKATTTPLSASNTSSAYQETAAVLAATNKLFADFKDSPQLTRRFRTTQRSTEADLENGGTVPRGRRVRMDMLQ